MHQPCWSVRREESALSWELRDNFPVIFVGRERERYTYKLIPACRWPLLWIGPAMTLGWSLRQIRHYAGSDRIGSDWMRRSFIYSRETCNAQLDCSLVLDPASKNFFVTSSFIPSFPLSHASLPALFPPISRCFASPATSTSTHPLHLHIHFLLW